jgi:methylmalonyl-CoA mutase N-terminal domain/subunit
MRMTSATMDVDNIPEWNLKNYKRIERAAFLHRIWRRNASDKSEQRSLPVLFDVFTQSPYQSGNASASGSKTEAEILHP